MEEGREEGGQRERWRTGEKERGSVHRVQERERERDRERETEMRNTEKHGEGARRKGNRFVRVQEGERETEKRKEGEEKETERHGGGARRKEFFVCKREGQRETESERIRHIDRVFSTIENIIELGVGCTARAARVLPIFPLCLS